MFVLNFHLVDDDEQFSYTLIIYIYTLLIRSRFADKPCMRIVRWLPSMSTDKNMYYACGLCFVFQFLNEILIEFSNVVAC